MLPKSFVIFPFLPCTARSFSQEFADHRAGGISQVPKPRRWLLCAAYLYRPARIAIEIAYPFILAFDVARASRPFARGGLFGVRSEGRRGGEECVSTCSSRWGPLL